MPATIFPVYDPVIVLNRAFNNQAPSNTLFKSQLAAAGPSHASITAFAFQYGAGFQDLSEEALASKLLGNMGVLPNASLQTALTDYLVAVGKANVGIVALQLGQILSGLEYATGDWAIYKAAAAAWNSELTGSYNYSANPANTFPSHVGPIDMPGTTLSLTVGDDVVSSSQTTSRDDTILGNTPGFLSSADVVDGGRGVDTLKATLAAAAVVSPTLTNIEKVIITAGAGSEFSAARSTGLAELWVDAAAGAATFSNVNLATTVGIQNSGAGGA